MGLLDFTQVMLPAIENELQRVVGLAQQPGLEGLHTMLAYHLGWQGEGAGPEARGKRLRPLLVLLAASASGGEWERALPAAAAVELIHNFSLVHDDIQDQSPLRRGRPTLWTQWGVAQALNAGDTLFALAQLAILRLGEIVTSQVALYAARMLNETCLALTQGQYLDLAYEGRDNLTLDAYWPMIAGKTASLLSACPALGAMASKADERTIEAYRKFGKYLGLAFQVLDDLLGIWGDVALTGKSAESDLLSGKKSLPVLYGLSQNGAFAQRWREGSVTLAEVPALATQLEAEGGRTYTQAKANDLTDQALQALEAAAPRGPAGEALFQLTRELLQRNR